MEIKRLGKIVFELICLFFWLIAWTVQSDAQPMVGAEHPVQNQDVSSDVPSGSMPSEPPPGPGAAPYAGAPGPGMQGPGMPGGAGSGMPYPSTEPTGTYPYVEGAYNTPDVPDETYEEVSTTESKETGKVEITDTGNETISLDLRGIEVKEFLKVLSRKLNINIIPSKKVSGRVDLFLNNITYKDALDVVILSQGLAYEKRGEDIVLIMTGAEYEALYGEKFNEKRKLKILKSKNAQPKMVFNALSKLKSSVGNIIVDEVTGTIILIDTPEKLKVMEEAFVTLDESITTEIFELQYAKAADIKENVSSIVTAGTGRVSTDERTNTLIVKDLPGNMNKVKQAIMMLDQETKEVFIEAEIIEITLRDRLQSGVQWNQIMSNNFYDWILAGTFPSALGAGLIGTFTAGQFGPDTLSFLNTIADTKVISRPRIAVTNNQEATLMVGTREAYVTGTTSQSGESTITSDTVEFVDVGVKLTVVPTINRDGYITMKIKPEISSVSRTLLTGDPDAPRSQIPIVTTSEAETTVKIKDGTTIMIAGLRKNKDQKDMDGLPFFTRIPFLNLFLSRRDHDQDQTEIIVFLTPYIIGGEFMRQWDKEEMKKYPSHRRPENIGYDERAFKERGLKEKTGL